MDKNEFEKIVNACRFCLMCRHLCTIGNITYVETNTPRGQMLMLDCLGSDALESTPETRKRAAEVLFACSYCGHCQNNCVSSFRHPDAIMAARAKVLEEELPEQVKRLRKKVLKTGELYDSPKQAEGKKDFYGADVLLYIGSYIRNEAPEVAQAAVRLLEKAGESYTVLSGEGGTGMAAYLLGLPDEGQYRLGCEIEKINALLPGRVVCLSCEDLRALKGDVPGMDASALKIPVASFTACLLELIRGGKLANSASPGVRSLKTGSKPVVAWHDSDQGGRFLQEYDAPRELISSLQGIEYKELFWTKGEAASAGESGGLHFANEGLAGKTAAKRIEQVEGRGLDVLVTDSAEAKAQLKGAAGGDLKILHIAELL